MLAENDHNKQIMFITQIEDVVVVVVVGGGGRLAVGIGEKISRGIYLLGNPRHS